MTMLRLVAVGCATLPTQASPESDAVLKWSTALRDSADPAIGWFANDHDVPCAPGWSGFLCNHKDLPLGEVPLPLPPVTDPVRLNPVAMDLVRLNAVQPKLVPPLASGYKLIDIPEPLRSKLKDHIRGQLSRAGGDPRAIGSPDARSRIISKDKDDVFHTRVSSIPSDLKNEVSATFNRIIAEWVGMPLTYSAGFGARTYLRNATFAAHVDRYDTHVASAILNIDQQVDEDWPVVICDHEGNAQTVALKAGQALLYESARLLHSRPHPLQGLYYTNFFIHFRPQGWEQYLQHDDIVNRINHGKQQWNVRSLEERFRARQRERARVLGTADASL